MSTRSFVRPVAVVIGLALGAGGGLAACSGGGDAGDETAAAGSASAGSAPVGAAQGDARRTLVLPARARETVLHEMRLLLEAVHGVVTATAEGDRGAMAREARSGGTVIAVDRDPAIAKRLPEEFVELGSSTHVGFDSLAARIERGIGRDSALAELGSLTAKCVACHAGYRVVTPAMEGEGQ